MKKFFEQLWCGLRGHGGITIISGWHGRCKRCGAKVDLE